MSWKWSVKPLYWNSVWNLFTVVALVFFLKLLKRFHTLLFCLYFCLWKSIHSQKSEVRKRRWKPSNDREKQSLIVDPFSQFLEIFHLKTSLRHIFEQDCVTSKDINFQEHEKLLDLCLMKLDLRFMFLKHGVASVI